MDKQKYNWKPFRKKPCQIWAYVTNEEIYIDTLEGKMKANKGDYIIKGVKGEIYPCKPDIFHMSYEYIGCNDPAEGLYD